jgi:hypothetical protein
VGLHVHRITSPFAASGSCGHLPLSELTESVARSNMTQPLTPIELETAIVAVYRGPLEDFVSRRDALVKQLRAAKRREDANWVKLLRKPSRMAWVLDNIVDEDSASIEQLAAAISEAQKGADLRTTVDTVKAAVRAVAAAGARVAIRAGQPIEGNAIATAVHAVIGDADAFGEWRAGRLVEVPEGGGLDMLTTIKVTAPTTTPPPFSPRPDHEPANAAPRAQPAMRDAQPAMQDAELAKAARADLRRAEMSFADLRERSEHALQSVRDAQRKLDAAEGELLNAQAEAQARRADVERARREAEVAGSAMRDAERAVDAARARVIESSEG